MWDKLMLWCNKFHDSAWFYAFLTVVLVVAMLSDCSMTASEAGL